MQPIDEGIAELQTLYCTLSTKIDELDEQVKDQALQRSGAKLLMSHPGVGPVTALATDAFLGDPSRFADSKTLTSYIGIIPSEYSTGGRPFPMTLSPLMRLSGHSRSQETTWFSVCHLLMSHSCFANDGRRRHDIDAIDPGQVRTGEAKQPLA